MLVVYLELEALDLVVVANFYLISTESLSFPAAFDAADNLCESHMYEAGAMGIASAREQIC